MKSQTEIENDRIAMKKRVAKFAEAQENRVLPYFVTTLVFRDGFNSYHIIHVGKNLSNALARLELIESWNVGEMDKEGEDQWWIDNSMRILEFGGLSEITKDEYKVLVKYIVEW